ncbi:hypothetical protein RJ640_019786, partial [Escallonia rubra]
EREARSSGLKRKQLDQEPLHVSRASTHNQEVQFGNHAEYDRNSLPTDNKLMILLYTPGWLDCPPFGNEIGFLIPSKVPLGESFNEKIPSGKRYSPKQVIHQQKHLGRQLGLVVDLTNTNRYYPESDWTKEGVRYVKIKCRGRDAVPDNESVDKFVNEVVQFRSRQANANKYILVHCTHGHNRTGYMIAHFLVRNESNSVTEVGHRLPCLEFLFCLVLPAIKFSNGSSCMQALENFARARYPGIYKLDYIEALYNFYHEIKPDSLVCPQTPEWKRSSSDQDDDLAAPLHVIIFLLKLSIDNGSESREMNNDDVLGDPVPPNQLESMRHFCYQALKLNVRVGRSSISNTPGMPSTSGHTDNLQLLRQRYYYATWKADGTRYMMLITWDGCYLIDRNFNFRSVQLRFPCRNVNEGVAGSTHHYTLLDGEMIIDTDPSTHKQDRRYLIYDLIAINQVSVVERPFHERWMILENEVIKPRNYERDLLYKTRSPFYRYDLELFRVRRKDFYLLSTVTKLLKEFIPRLSHAADGLIFQGWDDPYVPRTHEGLLKWKYPEMNSVDFLFEVGMNNRQLLFLNERGKKKLMEGNRVVFKDASDIFTCSGKIIECSWDSAEEVWIFMRMRPDKSTPNEFNTYRKVMRSITDNITEEVVLNEINEIIRLPMYADRIKNDCRAFSKTARRS